MQLSVSNVLNHCDAWNKVKDTEWYAHAQLLMYHHHTKVDSYPTDSSPENPIIKVCAMAN